MRTTLNLDPKIPAAARRLAAARGESIGEVISQLACKGLWWTVAPSPSVAFRSSGLPKTPCRSLPKTCSVRSRVRDDDGPPSCRMPIC